MTTDDFGNRPFIIDEITLICDGCQGERRFPLDPHLHSAVEVTDWLKTNAKQCPHCTASSCSAKLRLVNPS